jgi:SnoaL-like polyketide cyclase
MTVEENKQLMITLDDAWNSQDWDTFNKRHAEEVAVYWPGQPDPTRGQHAHQEEVEQFFKTFPDNRVGNRPYVVLFGEGHWTCSVANFTGPQTRNFKSSFARSPTGMRRVRSPKRSSSTIWSG